MSGIDRIGSASRISRDTASAGLEAQSKRADAEAKAQTARNPKLEEAAKLMEKQFLREMVRAMRATVSFGAEKPSMGEMIYRGELDNQYVESWGDNGGVGLADLIYDQVMEKYFNSTQGRSLKGQPIPITDRDVSNVVRMKSEAGAGQVPLKLELRESPDGGPGHIKAPWSGEVVSNVRLDGGKTALTLQHGPDLRSTLVFQGVVSDAAGPGEKVEQGRTVGVLSPEIRSFFWNLQHTAWDLDGGLASLSANGLQEMKNESSGQEKL